MTPEYIRQLADIADPDKLWRLGVFEQLALPPEKRQQLDTGIALRRHAAHVEEVLKLLGTGKSLVITPLASNGTAVMTIPIPPNHLKLLAEYKDPTL